MEFLLLVIPDWIAVGKKIYHNSIFKQIIKIKYNWEWGLRQHKFEVKGLNYQNWESIGQKLKN